MTYTGRVENGLIVLDDANANLPEGGAVRVEVSKNQPHALAAEPESSAPSAYEKYQSIIGSITDMPEDFSAEHDHHLYGTPKKEAK